MKRQDVDHYRNPADGGVLTIENADGAGSEVVTGALVSASGERFTIENGIPNLLWPKTLAGIEEATKEDYDKVADEIYDRAMEWQFASFFEDEEQVREILIDLIEPRLGMRVLEVGCGTGRDSHRLARRLGPGGVLHMQDLSPRMLDVCRDRMTALADRQQIECKLEYSVSSATALPYPDDYFDAVFHFGGFNQFGDLKRGASEMTRVVKQGGRVMYGDEAVAPWLKGTEFDGIVTTNNPLFRADIPLDTLPASARDVTVRWVIANCFYAIAFTKGDGPPKLDLDRMHAGGRGGSMRTRYFGVLEGVSPETKALAEAAASKSGLSRHEWLDRIVKSAAQSELI